MRRTIPLGVSLLLACACARHVAIAPLPQLGFAVDTSRAQLLEHSVLRRYVYSSTGPWAIHVLDVDLTRCAVAVAVKGADSAAARIRTSVMMSGLNARSKVLGGVNADFFSLANGTPTGLLIVNGRLFTPPTTNGVLAFDSTGSAHIGRFTITGQTLQPFFPREAVGGRQILVRDSVISEGLDSAGGAAFGAARHPRTAAGVSGNGRRLILAVVDGRQKPYSDGMSLDELAHLMRSLGARDALNLDGGGSTTLVFADPDHDGALHIANHPSDPEGERAVGDALALVNRCR